MRTLAGRIRPGSRKDHALDARDLEVLRLYDADVPQSEIARRMSIAQQTVSLIVNMAFPDEPLRPRRRARKP
jgi:predicted DNA-binding protein (UPF0251 family)